MQFISSSDFEHSVWSPMPRLRLDKQFLGFLWSQGVCVYITYVP